ncbi:MAG: hypothetical protein IJG60_09520 [Thermoguttaceae bacterium]|nr:hypothetical protein [Thermoguttaceae bacterium]
MKTDIFLLSCRTLLRVRILFVAFFFLAISAGDFAPLTAQPWKNTPDLETTNGGSISVGKETFTLTTGTIRNIGRKKADAGYIIKIYASVDNTVSPERDTLLAAYTVRTALSPNQSAVERISDIPFDKLSPGKSYYIGWIIEGVKEETETKNNSACCPQLLNVAVTPDLTAEQRYAEFQTGEGGLTVTIPVKNIGSGRADSGFKIKVYASNDKTISENWDTLLKEFYSTPSIGAGQKTDIKISGIPAEKLQSNRNCYIGWIITDVRGETALHNNTDCCEKKLSMPDLEAQRGGSIQRQNGRFTLTTGIIKNIGTERAEPGYKVKVYASSDTSISPNWDTLLKTFTVSTSLYAGQTTTLKIPDIPTEKLTAGRSYYIGWIIEGVKGETVTKNNTAYCEKRID